MTVAARPDLLFIAPTVPALTGNGLAMRAGVMLEALAADHDVHLLVVPVFAAPFAAEAIAWARQHCVRTVVHHLPSSTVAGTVPAGAAVAGALAIFRAVTFREVFVFRLGMAPFAEAYLARTDGARPRCRLDLDDHECETHRRLAVLYRAAGFAARAAAARAEVRTWAAMEAHWVPRFERVYLASDPDRRDAQRRHGFANLAVLPNAVRNPGPLPAHPDHAPFSLLFVGSLGYYPNEDAMLFFCEEILPRLRALTRRPVRLVIAGTDPGPRLRALASQAGVVITGRVADLAPVYAEADAVVVPLRAGGGTRIKILEAFVHRRPVVSTSRGAEGLEVEHHRHLLLADTPQDFAAQCARLAGDPVLGESLTARGFELAATRHTVERVRAVLRTASRGRRAPPRAR